MLPYLLLAVLSVVVFLCFSQVLPELIRGVEPPRPRNRRKSV